MLGCKIFFMKSIDASGKTSVRTATISNSLGRHQMIEYCVPAVDEEYWYTNPGFEQ